MQFLATGKHDLRGARRTLTSKAEPLVGFKTYFRLTRPERNGLSGTVEVILFRGGYAGLQMVEGGRANLCLLVHRDRLAAAGGTWETLLGDLQCESAHLRARLLGAEPLLPRPLTIAHVPYGFVHAPSSDDTIYRLGDQACVIPSFSGDGMSMALHSAALAVHCHSRGIPPQAYHRLLARHVRTPIRRAMALYRVANTPIGQTMVFQALRLWPGLMRLSAELTRVARNDWVAA
jgi:flavin-dependent dehydrogenase